MENSKKRIVWNDRKKMDLVRLIYLLFCAPLLPPNGNEPQTLFSCPDESVLHLLQRLEELLEMDPIRSLETVWKRVKREERPGEWLVCLIESAWKREQNKQNSVPKQ